MPKTDIKIHPTANIFPMMSDIEHAGLVEDIRKNGVRAIIQFRGDSWSEAELIDGRNRLKAILELGLSYRDWSDLVPCDDIPDPVSYVLSHNMHRRHLSESQRAMVAAKIANMTVHSNQHKTNVVGASAPTTPPISQAAAGEMLNVSRDSVKRGVKVERKGTEELQQAVTNGILTVTTAAKIAELPKPEQAAAIVEAKAPKPKPTPKAGEEPQEKPKPVAKPQPLGELQKLYDAMGPQEDKAVRQFAEWVLKQNDITVVHNGCVMWTAN